MKRGILFRVLICIFAFILQLYFYIDRQNDLTELQIKLPKLAKDVKKLNEENVGLRFEVDRFENPAHLLNLAKNFEFSHLKHPVLDEVLMVPAGITLCSNDPDAPSIIPKPYSQKALVIGTK